MIDEVARQSAVDELLALLELEPRGDAWVALTPDWFGPVVFGGVGLALTISGACRHAPPGARLHSLHAHFLRAMPGGAEITFTSEVEKAGRTFNLHRVVASHQGTPVITMMCSFTADTEGDVYVYDVSGIPDGVPAPEDLPEEEPDEDGDVGPFEARWLGPSERRADGTYESTHRHWFRLPRALDGDPHLHTALMGYATDWTGYGGRPHLLEGDHSGMLSLDHAAWFHRPPRVDGWHLIDVESIVNAGGRGALRSVIRDREGRVVASMAQEMLLRPPVPPSA